MIDGMESYEKSELKDGDFVKVKGNQLKFYEYTLAGEVNLDYDIYDSKKVYIKTYKEFLKEMVHYKVNADKVNILTYDQKGKLSEEKVFKRLTKEEKKLDYDYKRDVRDDKKLFYS